MRDAAAAQRWIGDVLELVARARGSAVCSALCTACARRRLARLRRAGTRWFSRAARPPSCAPRRCRWATRWRSCSSSSSSRTPRSATRGTKSAAHAAGASRSLRVRWTIDAAATRSSRTCGRGLENQVLAAVKAVPLGQTRASACCSRSVRRIAGAIVERAHAMHDDDIGNFAPGLALAVGAPRDPVQSRLCSAS